jgi:hypothetical protein
VLPIEGYSRFGVGDGICPLPNVFAQGRSPSYQTGDMGTALCDGCTQFGSGGAVVRLHGVLVPTRSPHKDVSIWFLLSAACELAVSWGLPRVFVGLFVLRSFPLVYLPFSLQGSPWPFRLTLSDSCIAALRGWSPGPSSNFVSTMEGSNLTFLDGLWRHSGKEGFVLPHKVDQPLP